MDKSILVTGFKPFGKNEVNPSMVLLDELGVSAGITTLLLDVSYSKAKKTLIEKIEDMHPDFILSFGLAAKRKCICLERFAYNEMSASRPDEDGIMKQGDPIIEGASMRLETVVDLSKFRLPEVEVSENPGRFICNEVYYLALSSGIPSLFIHLPPFEVIPREKQDKLAFAILEAAEEFCGH